MAKRIKKPTVKPEKRREWLKRQEEDGESAPQIAIKDGYDVRTVRSQIELGRQEREARETRSFVMRNALEGHYQDMCKYAQSLKSGISGSGQISLEGSESDSLPLADPYIGIALRQHLPRSPLWKDLGKREQLEKKVAESEEVLKMRLNKESKQDARLSKLEASGEIQVIDAILAALAFQARAWAKGWQGLNKEQNLTIKPAKPGFVKMNYGFAQMGEVKEEHVEDITQFIDDFESKIKTWEELDNMRKVYTDLSRINSALLDELAIITHKRIVPGKCKYCPI